MKVASIDHRSKSNARLRTIAGAMLSEKEEFKAKNVLPMRVVHSLVHFKAHLKKKNQQKKCSGQT